MMIRIVSNGCSGGFVVVINLLKESNNEEAYEPGFEDELLAYFDRLTARKGDSLVTVVNTKFPEVGDLLPFVGLLVGIQPGKRIQPTDMMNPNALAFEHNYNVILRYGYDINIDDMERTDVYNRK
ncbi:hypothetical protein L1987_16233 [Smallanthus sonchifolius]|uniref:Uncharacterized protein n=1 Tax=Smallanthus sonchifolius TaxID=185202 RepID=A0ACB9J864_9ASTR|nr:hypothetical protein L1987_16233 [Smallanthus sonchifolius]